MTSMTTRDLHSLSSGLDRQRQRERLVNAVGWLMLSVALCCVTAYARVENPSPKDMTVVAYHDDWKLGHVLTCNVEPVFGTLGGTKALLVCGKQMREEWYDGNDLAKNYQVKLSSKTLSVTFSRPMLWMQIELMEKPEVDSRNAHLPPISCTRTKLGLTCR